MDYAAIEWRDGQPYSKDFDDVYFSVNDGRSESEYVFLQQNQLAERFAAADKFVIAETGFGTGLNFALTLKLWQEQAPAEAQLDYIGIDFAPLSPADIARAASFWPELKDYFAEFLKDYPLPVAGRHLRFVLNKRVRLHLAFMDVSAALQHEALAVNAWYLDGFSPAKNPQIWNDNVYALLAQNSAQDASLATYTAAGAVRRGLEQAGFNVEKRSGHANKREMITAQFAQSPHQVASLAPWYRLPLTTAKEKHAVVVGAGLAGLTVARSLVRRGWRITLVEKHADIAAEASGNPVGLVLPRFSLDATPDARFYRAAFLQAVADLDELQAAHASLAHDDDLWRGEGVCCAMPAARALRLLSQNEYAADYIRPVDNSVAGLQLPVNSSLLFVPSAGWASPELICRALQAECGDHLQLLQNNVAALHQVKQEGVNCWRLLSADGTTIVESEVVVLANGVAAAHYEQTAYLPIQSARGQLTELRLNDAMPWSEQAFSGEHYLAPSLSSPGKYYCGASYHLDDACTELRHSDQQANLKFVEQYFPGVFAMSSELCGRVGFRAVSDDRMPVVGPVPDANWFEAEYSDLRFGRPVQNYRPAKYLEGLFVSAAHGSRGITSCFLCAEIIAAQIEQTPLPVEQDICAALNPARFIIRRLKRAA